MFFSLLVGLAIGATPHCEDTAATTAYQSGFSARKQMKTDSALRAYLECLRLDPNCVACQYELGWTYWSRGQWDDVVNTWEGLLRVDPDHSAAQTWLPQARARQLGRTSPKQSKAKRRPSRSDRRTQPPHASARVPHLSRVIPKLLCVEVGAGRPP